MIRKLRGLLVASAALCALASPAFAQNSSISYTPGSGGNLGANTCGGYKCAQYSQSFQNLTLNGGAGFTFGTGTTGYGSGTLLCNSTTVATCNTAIAATYFTLPSGTIHLSGGAIRITDTTTTAWATNAQIWIDLWGGTAPTVSGGDRTAYTIATGTAYWVASLLCTTAQGEQGDGATFNCALVSGAKDINLGAANGTLYATFESYNGSGITASSAVLWATLLGTY